MAEFTIYNRKTGAIIRYGFCNEEDLDAQAAPGETLFAGAALSDATHSFAKGKPVAVPSPRSAADVSWAINAERGRRIQQGTVISGVYVPGDDATREVMRGLAFKADRRVRDGSSEPIIFRDASNVEHSLAPAAFMAIYDATDTYFEAVAVRSWQIKDMQPPPADLSADDLWPTRTLPES